MTFSLAPFHPLRLGALALPAVLVASLALAQVPTPDPKPSGPTMPGVFGGGLMVAPTRVVFEGRARTAEITLLNSGAETATYRLSFVQMRMLENGEFKEIKEPGPGEKFSDHLVRFSPRQVTLAPGEMQSVRMQLRKPAGLADGEYRSHLMFRAVPPPPEAVADAAPKGRNFNVQLTAVFGVSIPVIVRHGKTAATSGLSALKLSNVANGAKQLTLTLERGGNASIYGDLRVVHVPQKGAPVELGRVNGIAVYAPNPSRRVTLALKPPSGVTLDGVRLRVTFADAGQPETIRATAELPLE